MFSDSDSDKPLLIQQSASKSKKVSRTPISKYGSFVYWLSRLSTPQKLAVLIFLKRRGVLTQGEKNAVDADVTKCCKLGCCSLWPKGQSVPLVDKSMLKRAIRIEAFFDGVKNFSEGVWPAAFWGLFAYDFIYYLANRKSYYGNTRRDFFLGGDTFRKIFLEGSPNQHPLTAALPKTWGWGIALLATPLILGIYKTIQRWNLNVITRDVYKDIDKAAGGRLSYFVDYQNSWFNDFFKWILPSSCHELASKLEKSVRFISEMRIPPERSKDGSVNTKDSDTGIIEERTEVVKFIAVQADNRNLRPAVKWLFDEILKISGRGKKITRLKALKTIASIIGHLHLDDIEKLKNAGVDNGDIKRIKKFRSEALSELRRYAEYTIGDAQTRKAKSEDQFFSTLRYIYARYLLWSLGEKVGAKKVGAKKSEKEPESKRLHLLFWFYTGISAYTKFRLYTALIQFAVSKINWLVDWHNCHEQGKQWEYMPQAADYQCTVCGDWKDVYYPHVFSAQACIDDFLKNQKNVYEIFAALNRLSCFGLQNISLAAQDWPNWYAENWQGILLAIQAATNDTITQFNLAKIFPSNSTVDFKHAQILSEFLSKVKVTEINLGARGFDTNATLALTSMPSNGTLTAFDFSGNSVNVDMATALAKYLANIPTLQELAFSNCDINDADIINLMPALSQLNITYLDLANNKFGQLGVDVLAQNVSKTLETLNLSGNDFSGVDLELLGQNLLSSGNFKNVIFSDAKLDDDSLSDFLKYAANSSLERADFSNNRLTDISGLNIPNFLKNSTVRVINLSGNFLENKGTIYLISGLNETRVADLDLSRNAIDDVGIIDFSRYLPTTHLKILRLDGNKITETGIAELAPKLLNSTIGYISLAYNQFGDDGANIIGDILNNSALWGIDLGNNKITSKGILSIVNVLHNKSNITHLILRDNFIKDDGFPLLAGGVKASNLKVFDVSNCSITQKSSAHLRNLTNPAMQKVYLDNNNLGDKAVVGFAGNLITNIPHMDSLGSTKVSRDQIRAIFNANASTAIMQISLRNSNITDIGGKALCEVLPSTDTDIAMLDLQENLIKHINFESCWISSAASLKTPFVVTFFYVATQRFYRLAIYPQQFFSAIPFSVYEYFTGRENALCKTANQDLYCIEDISPKINPTDKAIELFEQSPQSFLELVLNGITQTQPGFNISFVDCSLAIGLAFYQEIYAAILKHMPQRVQQVLHGYEDSKDITFIKNTAAFAARCKYSGYRTFIYDTVSIGKSIYEVDKQSVNINKNKSSWWSRAKQAAQGLISLGGYYGIPYAIGTLTGNPLLGFLVIPFMPFILNGKKIVNRAATSYHRHGFFSAVDSGFEAFVFSAPLGYSTEYALYPYGFDLEKNLTKNDQELLKIIEKFDITEHSKHLEVLTKEQQSKILLRLYKISKNLIQDNIVVQSNIPLQKLIFELENILNISMQNEKVTVTH